jgi:hypothetical protein
MKMKIKVKVGGTIKKLCKIRRPKAQYYQYNQPYKIVARNIEAEFWGIRLHVLLFD